MSKSTILLLVIVLFSIFFRFGEDRIVFTDTLLIEDAAFGFSKGEWRVVPETNGRVDLVKPPLVYWLSSIPYFFFEPTPALRSWLMPIFGMALALFTYKFAKDFYGSKTAFLASILLTTSIPFIIFTKAANFDLPNSVFVTASIYFYNKAKTNQKYIVWMFLSLALGFLTRSLLSLFAVLLIALDYFFNPHKRFSFKKLFVGSILFILLVVPWHIAAYKLSPENFTKQYLKIPVSYYSFGEAYDSETGLVYYLLILILFPAGIFAFVYLFYALKKGNPIDRQLSLWIVLMFLILTSSKTHHIWYILPILTPLSILSAHFILVISHVKVKTNVLKTLTLTFLSVFIVSPVLIVVSSPFTEAEVVSATKVFVQATAKNEVLYLWKYPLLLPTRFFPLREVEIIQDLAFLNSEKFYVLMRVGDLSDFANYDAAKTVVYKGKDFILARFEEK